MKTGNPFILTVYAGPQYFCDREEETETIIDAVKNQRNITLISYRRMGKSGLIKHVFHRLRNERSMRLFYVDIMDTENLEGLVRLLAREIVGKMDSRPVRFMKKFGEAVKSLRPKLSVDPVTGQPEIEIAFQSDASPETCLSEIFDYLQSQDRHIVIAFDEFQQITAYPEKNVEAFLRKNIQQLTHTNFIFSGSKKHMLISMFSRYGKPFYQSAQLLNLEKIDPAVYKKFIRSRFEKSGRSIEQPALEMILKYTRRHTFYVQYLCNKLYGSSVENISTDVVAETVLKILEENAAVYLHYKLLLTDYQFKLLEAVAKADGVSQPTSKEFISKYRLGTPSSAATALKALFNKEMLLKEGKVIHVYDVFFSLWLARRNTAGN